MVRWYKKKKHQFIRALKWKILDWLKLEMLKIIRVPGFHENLVIVPLHRNGANDRELSFDDVVICVTMPSWNRVTFDILWNGRSSPSHLVAGGSNFSIPLFDPSMIRLAAREYLCALMANSLKFNQVSGLQDFSIWMLFPDLRGHKRPTITPWKLAERWGPVDQIPTQ
ncbi:MAG: hypothetical protein P4L77_11715 [Sulfuriferula sp.]|nr:hypothetical protein [Sulfuriferula sp.]